MNKNDIFGFPIGHTPVGDFLTNISYASKKANDWKWLKDWADYLITGNSLTKKEYEKIMLNYRLYNSRGVITKVDKSEISSEELQEEGIYFDDENIENHDILTPIIKSLEGQQQLMPFKPIVTDSSLTNVNARKKKKIELCKQYLQENLIDPARKQAYQEWVLENGDYDPYTLSPEQQQQANSEIDAKVKGMLPEDMDRYMASEYKSPSEVQLNKITELVIKRDKLKFWTDYNFKNMLLAGKQAYKLWVNHDQAQCKPLNPIGCSYGGNQMFFEDKDWFVYKEPVSISYILNEFGDQLNKTSLNKLKEYINSGGIAHSNNPYKEFNEPVASGLMYLDNQTGFFDNAPNLKTKEGQEFYHSIFNTFGNNIINNNQFVLCSVAFKHVRELQLVDRYNKEKDIIEQFWVDESYEKNEKKDIRIRKAWFPQVYYVDVLDLGSERLYFNKGPLKNQYKNFNKPWDVKLPFFGAEYSSLFGNTENVAVYDLGKKWQNKYNIQMAKITELEATDIGKVMAVAVSMKPKDWSYGKWLMMAKYGKILPLDTSNEDINGIDAQIMKDLNMSQVQDLAAKLDYLEYIERKAAMAMGYNPSRLGQIAPSTAVSNNQQNIQQSSYQTQDIFTLQNEITERVLNQHILNERAALKSNDYIASYVLDDMSRADLELDKELFDLADIGISLRNSSEDFNTLNNIKQLSQAMIQNQMISFPELIRLNLSNSMADALNISERADKKMMERQQLAQQNQFQQEQKMVELQQHIREMEKQWEAIQKQLDRENKLDLATITASQFKNQMDVNQDNQSDLIEKEELTIENDNTQNEKNRIHELKIKQMEMENKLKLEKIKASRPTKK